MHDVDVHVRWGAARVGGRAPTAEPRGGEIERSPEELDGARLAEKSGAESLEDHVGAQERGRELARAVAVVRAERDVFGKRYGDGDLVRHRVNLCIAYPEPLERVEHLAVEVRDRHRAERHRTRSAAARDDGELVRDEV